MKREKTKEKREFADIVYENRYAIIGIIVALVILILGMGFYKHSRTKRAQKASLYYSQGIKSYLKAQKANATERQEKLEKAIKYLKVAEELKAGRISTLAQLMEGRVLIEMGKTKEGKVKIKKALDKLPNKSLMKPVFASTAEDPRLLENILSENSPFLEAYVRYTYAISLIKLGKKEEAKRELEQLKGKFPNSPFAMDAKRILEVLE